MGNRASLAAIRDQNGVARDVEALSVIFQGFAEISDNPSTPQAAPFRKLIAAKTPPNLG